MSDEIECICSEDVHNAVGCICGAAVREDYLRSSRPKCSHHLTRPAALSDSRPFCVSCLTIVDAR